MSTVRNRIAVALVAIVAAGVGLASRAGTQNVDPDLRKAIDARDAARTSRNYDVWSKMTTDDYMIIDEAGIVRSKTEQVAQFKASSPTGQPTRRRDEKIRLFGTTAVLTQINDAQTGPRREIHVWVKQGGQWKVASVQMTRIAKP